MSTGVIVGEIAAGILMKPLGHTKCQLITSTILVTTFSGALAATNQYRQSYGLAFTSVGGFAVGYLESITIIMCPLYCKPEDIGLASGFLGSAKQICGTIATSIYIAVLHGRVAVNLPRDVSAAALSAGLPGSSLSNFLDAFAIHKSSAIERVPGVTNRIIVAATDASKTAYSQSFRTVFLVSISFGVLSTIAAMLSVSVDDKLDNAIAAKLLGTDASQESINDDQEK
ncbi:hypothetical protein VI817_000344 [Penicillium citrinum]|nr:hypothetical protein VI817_000344 [Penicillium citrinum]